MTDDRNPDAPIDPEAELDARIRAGVHALAAEAPMPPVALPEDPQITSAPVGASGPSRHRILLATAAVVLVVVAIAAVVATRTDDPDDTVRAGTTTTTAPVADLPLFDVRWALESGTIDGKPVDLEAIGGQPDVVFSDDLPCFQRCGTPALPRYSFSDGCNDGGGTVRIEGHRMFPTGGPITAVGCSQPTVAPFGWHRLGGAGAELAPSTFEIDGDALILRGEEGRILTYRASADGLPDRKGTVVVDKGGNLAYQVVARVADGRTTLTFDRTFNGERHESASVEAEDDDPEVVASKAHASGGDLVYGLVPADATKVTYVPSKTDPIDLPLLPVEGSTFQAIATLVPPGDQHWSILATDADGNEVGRAVEGVRSPGG